MVRAGQVGGGRWPTTARKPVGIVSVPNEERTSTSTPWSRISAGTSEVSISTFSWCSSSRRQEPSGLQVAEIKGHHPAGPQRIGYRGQRSVDRRGVRQVIERMPDRDDRVGLRERVIGQGEQAKLRPRPAWRRLVQEIPGYRQHPGRCVGGDNLVAGPTAQADPLARLWADLDDSFGS